MLESRFYWIFWISISILTRNESWSVNEYRAWRHMFVLLVLLFIRCGICQSVLFLIFLYMHLSITWTEFYPWKAKTLTVRCVAIADLTSRSFAWFDIFHHCVSFSKLKPFNARKKVELGSLLTIIKHFKVLSLSIKTIHTEVTGLSLYLSNRMQFW